MPRTVRIGPVPVPPPPVEPRARRPVAGPLGAVLLVLAALAALGYVVASGSGAHSYDRHPTPPATIRLTAGADYTVSTADGPDVAPATAPLTCTLSPTDGAPVLLSVTAEGADSRATHAVARFVAPVGGEVAIACSGGRVGSRPVFVDDADSAAPDLAGVLLVLCAGAATVGAALVLAALSGRPGRRRVSGVTTDPAA